MLRLKALPVDHLSQHRMITIKPNPDQDASNREHYAINVTPDGTHLSATTVSGVIYGASTLVQLYQNKALSNLERIEDGPRYSWRGLLIDPARHFLCVSLLERIIDGMARLPAVAERLWSDQAHPDFGNRLDALLQSPPYHLEARQRTALAKLGLTAEQTTIALLLEPVKWYARLLGRDALEARISGHEMPQARPYQVHTPLNRVVDMISPESRSATALKRGTDADWLLLADTLLRQDTSQWPDDTRPVIEAFKAFADQIHNGDRAAAQALYVPHGEYMIAAIHAWLNRA